MGVLDILLGRDEQGNASKINMALIALLLWRWYQASGRGSATPAPAGRGEARIPPARNEMPEISPARVPAGKPAPSDDLGGLLESMREMPKTPGGSKGRDEELEIEEADDEPGRPGGGPGGGGLGDILGEILRGGRGAPSDGGGPRGGQGGGGLGDILGDVLGGGRGRPGGLPGGRGPGGPGGGGLGDILGDILGGGRAPARVAAQGGNPGGSLNDIIPGGLGGLLAGGAAGGVLGELLRQFEQSGQGAAAKSWVSRGENIPVTPRDIEKTFGADIINQLAAQFDMPREQLLSGLSEAMPQVVNELTPDGRLPTPEEISRRA